MPAAFPIYAIIVFTLAATMPVPFSRADDRGQARISTNSGQQILTYTGSYAIVIGNADYQHQGWSDLTGVPGDVNAVSDALQAQGFKVQREENLSGAVMEQRLKAFLVRYGYGKNNEYNRLLIYIAGHGATVTVRPEEDMGYIVPVDAPALLDKDDASLFQQAALSMDKLVTLTRPVRSRHVMVVLDNCFAGTIFQSVYRDATRPSPALAHWMGSAAHQFITAGDANQKVPDRSIFRRTFVLALQGKADKNRDGYIIGTELGRFLVEQVSRESNGNQTPLYGMPAYANAGEYILSAGLSVPEVLPTAPETRPASSAAVSAQTSPSAGAVFKDCQECPEMVLIPSGRFLQGSPFGEPGRGSDEGPQRSNLMERPFAIGRYEITFQEWDACVQDGGCNGYSPATVSSKGDRRPVTNVSWEDAQSYVDWLNRKWAAPVVGGNLVPRYRLPSEREWEYAARAGSSTPYATGFTISPTQARFNAGDEPGTTVAGPAVVGSFVMNGFGLYDMHGNVQEWNADCYKSYSDMLLEQDGGADFCLRNVRGGHWASAPEDVRSARRFSRPFGFRSEMLGFRVARDMPPVQGQ